MDYERSVGFTSLDSWPTSDRTHSEEALNREAAFALEEQQPDHWREAIALDPITPRHLRRYDACGENAWIQENPKTGHCRVTFNTCKLRVCPICSRIAARRTKQRLTAALEGTRLRKWRLITLTLPSTDEPLKTSIESLKSSFKRLRKSANWKKYITGGYAVLEVTLSPKTGRWHPHFHVVAGGLFYPWKELRADWLLASDGATVTDIRAIKTTAGAIHYLTAYLSKLPKPDGPGAVAKMAEYYRTIQGSRFLIAFGKAPPPRKPDKKLALDEWKNVCPLWQWIIALRDGQPWAARLSRMLHKKPLDELAICDHHPPPPA